MKKVFIAGHRGMVGSAILRNLQQQLDLNVITRNRDKLDLSDQKAVLDFMESEKPDEVILAAAKVGGIYANDAYPAEFIYQNLQIQNNVIHAAHLNDVQKLLFLGSSCIYPKQVQQPIREDALLTGALEPTNSAYSVAKIAGIKMCESYNRQYARDYRCIMPSNLYGRGDNYHPENSHVIPALINRFHYAKKNKTPSTVVWGTGVARREFLHVDDLASAAVFIHNLEQTIYDEKVRKNFSHLNVGTGKDLSIKELAKIIKEVVGYAGKIFFDNLKPDGTLLKKMDCTLINSLGWQEKIDLRTGLHETYDYFLRDVIK